MEKVAGHYDKVVLTLIMCLAILFMATFTPFAQSANAVAIVDDAVIAIIIAGLAAVGITFATTGSFDTLTEYVRNLIDEFCEDNSISTSQFLNGTQSGTNKLGQILINNRFVIAISTFAEWILAKFNVSDNSVTTIETQGNYLGNCTLAELPAEGLYIRNNYSERWEMELLQIRGTASTYIEGNGIYIFVSTEPSTVQYNLTVFNSITGAVKRTSTWSLTLSQNSFTVNNITFNPTTVYAASKLETDLQSGNWNPSIPDNSLQNMAQAINSGATIRHNEGIAIHSGDITIPLDDDDYTDGDGAIIDVGASWGASYEDVISDSIPNAFDDADSIEFSITYDNAQAIEEEVEETQETTNLPSGAIPFVPLALPNFSLVSIWHYVRQWIEDTAVAAGSLMAIATQAPSPMVNLFYAITCLGIIFGFIKGMAK